MKILEIKHLEFLFKIRFRIKIEFKLDFETKDIFKKGKVMILERLRLSFDFKIESNTGLNESGHFLLAL
jgi:hypothetical protein